MTPIPPPNAADLPSWFTEPARRIGRWIASATAALAFVLGVLTQITALVPVSAQDEVSVALGVVGAVVAAMHIVQAELTRSSVYSPASVEEIIKRLS